VLDWQKMGDDLGVKSLLDHGLFDSRKSPASDNSPSR
jgi:hypothetical protein